MDALTLARADDITTVTLTRPDRRNVLALEVLEALTEAFEEVGDTDRRGIILAGAGPVFSAGHDFADMADGTSVRCAACCRSARA